MAKFTPRQKLSQKEETDLIIEFCSIVNSLSDIEETTLLIRDLLSKAEIRMLSKRLKIAKLLIEGITYEKITKDLKVSHGTIARINFWLNQSGQGFRLAAEKKNNVEEVSKPTWRGLKRKYPMYHWPEVLLKEIVYSANKQQRERLKNIISSFDEKNEVMRELDVILRKKF